MTTSVSVVDARKLEVVARIPVGQRPWNMAFSPEGGKLYVANGRSRSVSVIDTAANRVARTIEVGERPWGVLVP